MKSRLSILCVVLSLFVVLATARAFAQTEGRITTNIPVGREVPRSRAERELERAEAKNLVHAVTVIPVQ
jgi:hypothetical protein